MPNLTLDDCLNARVTDWDRLALRNNGFNVEAIQYYARLGGVSIEVRREELDAIDSRLPDVIDYHLRKTNRDSTAQLVAIIAASLHYWHRPRLKVTAPEGRLARAPRFFLAISEINSDPTGRDGFLFVGTTFKLRHRQEEGKLGAHRIKLDTEMYMSCASLDEQYPGSVARLSMGLSIGLNAAELVDQLFGAGAAQDRAMLPDLLETQHAR